MKKIVYILVAVAAFCFASCEKENDAIVFKATAEAPMNDGKTRVTFGTNGGELSWTLNDAVKIKCENGTNWYTFVKRGDNNTFSCLTTDAVGFDMDAASYQAVYPASLEDGGVITLPNKQYYVENSVSEFPMYTETTNDHLNFNNVCGLLKLTVNGNITVSEIWVSSSQAMCGAVSVGNSSAKYAFAATSTASEDKQVKLMCGNGVVVNESQNQNFYIYLPQNEYTDLTVTVLASNGDAYVRKAQSAQSLTITRNKVTTLPFTITGAQTIEAAELHPDDLYECLLGLFSEENDVTSFVVKYGCSATEFTGSTPFENSTSVNYKFANGTCTVLTDRYQINGLDGDWTGMFMSCPFVVDVNLGDYFNLSNFDVSTMFSGLPDLGNIYLGKRFGVPSLVTEMFDDVNPNVHIYCSQETADAITERDYSGVYSALPSTATITILQ